MICCIMHLWYLALFWTFWLPQILLVDNLEDISGLVWGKSNDQFKLSNKMVSYHILKNFLDLGECFFHSFLPWSIRRCIVAAESGSIRVSNSIRGYSQTCQLIAAVSSRYYNLGGATCRVANQWVPGEGMRGIASINSSRLIFGKVIFLIILFLFNLPKY